MAQTVFGGGRRPILDLRPASYLLAAVIEIVIKLPKVAKNKAFAHWLWFPIVLGTHVGALLGMKGAIDGRRAVADGQVLSVRLFGTFHLSDQNNTEILVSNRRAKALLAMLCLAPGETIERAQISKLLWPGRFEAQARASLRQCLLALGKLVEPLGGSVLDVSRTRVCLVPGHIISDLDRLEAALEQDRTADACALLMETGAKPLLDQIRFSGAFEQWLEIRRAQIECRIETAVHHALRRLEHVGRDEERTDLLEAWKLRDPDAAHKAAIRRHEGKIRLAVLPFEQIDSVGGRLFLADGVVEELITTLGKVPQLLVTGRTSSSHFRDSELTLPDIAAALDVTHLVEGTVQRHADKVRVHVRLIDGETGFESWGFHYDGSLEDIFVSREHVARAATAGLCEALGVEVAVPQTRSMTDDREAYALYLQGCALTVRAIGEGVLSKAIELLEKALERDPAFAECWTALAEAHVYTAVYTPCLERMAQSEKMAECAHRAIELAPDQGHARSMLAIHKWTQNDIVGAIDLALEAYRLEPKNSDVCVRLGSFLLYIGRSKQALPYIQAAIELDPVHGRNYSMLCAAYLNLGQVDPAIEAGQRMVDLGFPSMWLAAATAASGESEKAVEQYQQTRLLMNSVIFAPAGTAPMAPEMMEAYWTMAAKGLYSGMEEDRLAYCQVLDMLYATLPDRADSTIVLPSIWLGYPEMLFKSLGEQVTPANFFGLMSLWTDTPHTRRIREHPEFMAFARKIGLVAAWEKYGWPDIMPASPEVAAALKQAKMVKV